MIKKWLLLLFMAAFLGNMAYSRAQSTGASDLSQDDTYDPFADYSEFEATADEEADIHFFKNGRFFNLAFLFGGRMFTGGLGELTAPGPTYGLYIAYFFDIRTALQISYVHGDHNFNLASGIKPGDGPYQGFSGQTTMSAISANMKYYFNTENVTRGFADLNPYIIGGFSSVYRTTQITGESVLLKSSPTGIGAGFGLEVPIAREKMYLGFQVMYHYIGFPDENDEILSDSDPTGLKPDGDAIEGFLVLGINF